LAEERMHKAAVTKAENLRSMMKVGSGDEKESEEKGARERGKRDGGKKEGC